jgi:hexosaminidase
MKLALVLVLLPALLASAAPLSPRPDRRTPSLPYSRLEDYGNIGVWPLPANATYTTNTHLNPAQFAFALSPAGDPFLAVLASRYRDLIFFANATAPSSPPSTLLTTLSVTVLNTSSYVPQASTDESYTLTFASDGSSAAITAATVFGARHGLETFSQLVQFDRVAGAYSVSGLNVVDAPRYPWRGLLVDSSRHWLTPNHLLNVLDGLAFSKLNFLQVGFGIDWSWTVESLAYPNLTQVSYGPKGTHVYSRDTVRWLVQEAAYRGVRLVPYFEVVGHDALGYAVPELMFCNGKNGSGLPHPLHNETWDFFDALWADYKLIFPEEYMNVGGDEFDDSCWQNDTEIDAWLAGIGHPGDLSYIVAHYFTQMMASLRRAGFKPIFFAEAFGALNGTGVDLTGTDVVFDAWDEGTPGSAAPIIQAPGTQVIVSSYCFLCPTNSCPDNLPGGLTPNWDSNMQCELQNTTLFPPAAWPYLDKIVGGHPSRWGEQTDGTNLWTVTWPAVMGAAEKLWSPLLLTNGSYYGSRQEVFAFTRCQGITRGLPIQPTSAYCWSCDFEWEPAYPPITPLRPNPANSSWSTPAAAAAAEEAVAVSASSGPTDARIAWLEQRLAEAEERVRELEAERAA